MAIYQEAYLKQSILFSQGLFLDDELENSIGAVEPDLILHVAWKMTIGNQVVGIKIVDRPRIAEARKDFSALIENGKKTMIECSKGKKGLR